MWTIECEIYNVKYRMWNIGCEIYSEKYGEDAIEIHVDNAIKIDQFTKDEIVPGFLQHSIRQPTLK